MNFPYSDAVIVYACITLGCDEDKQRKWAQVVVVNTSPGDRLKTKLYK